MTAFNTTPLRERLSRISSHAPNNVYLGTVAVFVSALISRLYWALHSPGAVYFPDSQCYWPDVHGHVCRSGHSLMVRWVWVWLTRGHISERNVLIVQGASGVLAAMVLYWTLRRFRVRGAVIIASASAFIPSLVLMERAILTESLELFFLVVGIYAISVLLTTARLLVVLVSAPLGVAAMSLASALHPSALAGAIASDVLIAYLVIRHMRGRGHKLWRASLVGLSSSILAVAASIAMLVPMSHVYEHQYKMQTFNPIENITLAFRWSPIIPCSDSAHYEPLARYVINRACHLTDWVDPPGMNLRPTFSGATQYSIAHSPGTFARADKQIGAVVHRAILSNVPVVASQMWRSIKWQYLYAESHFVFHRASFYITPKMLSLPYFSTASRWFDSHTRPTVHDQFPAHLWSQSNKWIRFSNRLMKWTLLCWVVLGLIRLVQRYRRREGWTWTMPRWSNHSWFLLVVGANVLALMASIAFSSAPDARYFVPFIPMMLVALVVVLSAIIKELVAWVREAWFYAWLPADYVVEIVAVD